MQRTPMGSLLSLSLATLLIALTQVAGAATFRNGQPHPTAHPTAELGVEQAGLGSSGGVVDSGVGMYTDSSVANQISSFTINPNMVSCGVGTLANGQWSGPFAMLMYSTGITSYDVDRKAGIIRATGRMRSVTRLAGGVVEDVEHEFLAIAATDSAHLFSAAFHSGVPRFDVHVTTPFWSPSNPMCTRSGAVPGGCRFGGELLMGEINVSGAH